jgi:hypothetical protein
VYLERWTIDELMESTATLLRAQYREQVDMGEGGDLGQVVMAAELEVPADGWTEEFDSLLERADLTAFVNEAIGGSRLGGFREARSLREGDVYWITLDQEPPSLSLRVRPRDTGHFLAVYRRGRVQVGDVTAAARQAAKVFYSRAMEGVPKKRRGRGRGRRR